MTEFTGDFAAAKERYQRAVAGLYQEAGSPSGRKISQAVKARRDLPATPSHDTVARFLRGEEVGSQQVISIARQLSDWSYVSQSAQDRSQAVRRLMVKYQIAFVCTTKPDDYIDGAFQNNADGPAKSIFRVASRIGFPSAACIADLIGYNRSHGREAPSADRLRDIFKNRLLPDAALMDEILNALTDFAGGSIDDETRASSLSALNAPQRSATADESGPATARFTLTGVEGLFEPPERTSDFLSGLIFEQIRPATARPGRMLERDVDAHCAVVIRGASVGAVVFIDEGHTLVVGRSQYSDVPLDHPSVSVRHCSLTAKEGKLLVADKGSTNGTFVNDDEVYDRATLVPGSKVRLGAVVVVYLGIIAIHAGERIGDAADSVRQTVRKQGLLS